MARLMNSRMTRLSNEVQLQIADFLVSHKPPYDAKFPPINKAIRIHCAEVRWEDYDCSGNVFWPVSLIDEDLKLFVIAISYDGKVSYILEGSMLDICYDIRTALEIPLAKEPIIVEFQKGTPVVESIRVCPGTTRTA